MKQPQTKHLFEAISAPSIDAENRTIKGVSLIAIGQARGHTDDKGRQVYVDETTLLEVMAQCEANKSVKVKIDHGTGVFSTAGYVTNFSLKDDKVTADLTLYESETEAPRILEIANKNPHHMGISLEFIGIDEVSGDKCLARCSEIIAAALVSDPAAKKSLFSIDNPNNKQETTPNMDPEPTTEPAAEDPIEKILSRLEAIESSVAEMKKLAEPEPPADPPVDPPTGDKEKEMEKVAEMAATRAVKALSAALGVKLPPAGAPHVEPPKQKNFNELVAEHTTKFNGDSNKAMIHCIQNHPK